ncbi:mitochondrial cardiolipin hydrolase [Drosophila subobscura]|uniref:mitochondrial cardiolipin hydrolase n=1 Tax=Drosophila subobscura TaxID=7241 RepID=UPI00155A8F69|nr:mitochondrial cardiolipin hydrolase [Drosophila subobscura]
MELVEIFDLVRSHSILATVTMFAGTALASELLWKAIQYARRHSRRRRVHEVLFFNELGEICLDHHRGKSFTNTNDCSNSHCSLRSLEKIAVLMDEAQYSIDIAIYTFTSNTLWLALKRALQRGVSIRVISDREMVYSGSSKIQEMAAFGVPVRGPFKTNLIMHHKFCVIDGVARVQEILQMKQRKWPRPYESVLISGSVNWTNSGFGANYENCTISSDEVMTRQYQEEFNRMWKYFADTAEKFLESSVGKCE